MLRIPHEAQKRQPTHFERDAVKVHLMNTYLFFCSASHHIRQSSSRWSVASSGVGGRILWQSLRRIRLMSRPWKRCDMSCCFCPARLLPKHSTKRMVWSNQRSGFAENPAFAKICGRSTSWIHTWFNQPESELEGVRLLTASWWASFCP